MSFPCTACGACCRQIGAVLSAPRETLEPAYREALEAFPYQARQDGACEQLDEAGRCRVYETRPDLCNIETMILRTGVPRAARYALNALICNTLQEREGIDPSFRVTLTRGS